MYVLGLFTMYALISSPRKNKDHTINDSFTHSHIQRIYTP